LLEKRLLTDAFSLDSFQERCHVIAHPFQRRFFTTPAKIEF